MTVIPTTMKAAAIERFGPASELKIIELPVPEVGPDDVLIALQVAGVGIWDARVRDGTWATGAEPFPLVPGCDGTGYVVAKGASVRRLEVGDRVWAYEYANPKGGFYAEYVAVDGQHAARAPRSLDPEETGAATVTGLTALQGIDDRLDVGRRDTVLIFGASGAVGTIAVQLAKRRHSFVIGAASGRDGVALVTRLGADSAFDVRAQGAEPIAALAPDGIDAVLALAGGDVLEACIDRVRPGGRVAYPNGVEPEPRRRKGVRVIPYDAVAGPREFQRLERGVNEARLTVPIAAAYPLAEAAKAHERIEQGHVLGRIILRIRR